MFITALVLIARTILVIPPALATPQGVAGITRDVTPDSLEMMFFGGDDTNTPQRTSVKVNS